jgi:hypothetical protein
VYAPPVVCEHVKYAQNDDKEDSRPLGFEADGYHAASSETEERDEYSCNAPSTLEDKAEEQEDEEDTTGKQEAVKQKCVRLNHLGVLKPTERHILLLAVVFTNRRKPSE